jgi:DNA-binding transcriptional LysR family regulator
VDLRAVSIVIAVAERGSLSRAAEAVHISTSAVSYAVLGLERELKVELFHRLPRGMMPTDAGLALIAAGRRALHEAEVARQSVDAVRQVCSGTLTLAVISGCIASLSNVVGGYAEQYPGIVIRMLPAENNELVLHQVRSGECDVGVTTLGVSPELPEDVQASPGFSETVVIAVPSNHPLADAQEARVADLRRERLVVPLESSTQRPLFNSMFAGAGVTPLVVAEVPTSEVALELVRAGVGCTVTFESAARPLAGRGVAIVPIAGRPSRLAHLVTRERQVPTPATAAFVAFAAARYHRERTPEVAAADCFQTSFTQPPEIQE